MENLHQDKRIISLNDKEKSYDLSLDESLDELYNKSKFTKDEDFIFSDSSGNEYSLDFIELEFAKTMETAGIDYGDRKLTPNSFRRTWNFWYA